MKQQQQDFQQNLFNSYYQDGKGQPQSQQSQLIPNNVLNNYFQQPKLNEINADNKQNKQQYAMNANQDQYPNYPTININDLSGKLANSVNVSPQHPQKQGKENEGFFSSLFCGCMDSNRIDLKNEAFMPGGQTPFVYDAPFKQDQLGGGYGYPSLLKPEQQQNNANFNKQQPIQNDPLNLNLNLNQNQNQLYPPLNTYDFNNPQYQQQNQKTQQTQPNGVLPFFDDDNNKFQLKRYSDMKRGTPHAPRNWNNSPVNYDQQWPQAQQQQIQQPQIYQQQQDMQQNNKYYQQQYQQDQAYQGKPQQQNNWYPDPSANNNYLTQQGQHALQYQSPTRRNRLEMRPDYNNFNDQNQNNRRQLFNPKIMAQNNDDIRAYLNKLETRLNLSPISSFKPGYNRGDKKQTYSPSYAASQNYHQYDQNNVQNSQFGKNKLLAQMQVEQRAKQNMVSSQNMFIQSPINNSQVMKSNEGYKLDMNSSNFDKYKIMHELSQI